MVGKRKGLAVVGRSIEESMVVAELEEAVVVAGSLYNLSLCILQAFHTLVGLIAGTSAHDKGLLSFLYLGFGNKNEARLDSTLLAGDTFQWRVFGSYLQNDTCGILNEHLVELDK